MNLSSSAGPQPEAQSDSGYVLPPFSSDPTVVARRGAQTPHQTPHSRVSLILLTCHLLSATPLSFLLHFQTLRSISHLPFPPPQHLLATAEQRAGSYP